jgi:N-acetylneuraminate synthase
MKTLTRFNYPRTYIIAEIGINHNGDLDICKRLINLSAACGFDAVKFQKRNPDVCVPDDQKSKLRETPWGTLSYLDYKKKIEFGKKEYDEINKLCVQLKIDWSASPWDKDSVDFLKKYKLPWVKVPSALINDYPYLEYVGSNFKHVILSTGASTHRDVKDAYDILASTKCEHLDVLHCNSTYPAPVKDLNLRCIHTLKMSFPESNIGYSGHEYGLLTTTATVALGSQVIERHVTLDKGMWGSDQACSLEPHAMFKLVRGIRELESALGDDIKNVTDAEMEKIKTLRK